MTDLIDNRNIVQQLEVKALLLLLLLLLLYTFKTCITRYPLENGYNAKSYRSLPSLCYMQCSEQSFY